MNDAFYKTPNYVIGVMPINTDIPESVLTIGGFSGPGSRFVPERRLLKSICRVG